MVSGENRSQIILEQSRIYSNGVSPNKCGQFLTAEKNFSRDFRKTQNDANLCHYYIANMLYQRI